MQFAKEKNLQYLLTVYVNNIVVDSVAFPHDWLLCICILQLGIWVYFQMPTHYSKVSLSNSSPWLRWSLQTFIQETGSSGMPDALQKSVPLPPSLALCPGIVWIDKDAANETWNLIPFFDVLFNGRYLNYTASEAYLFFKIAKHHESLRRETRPTNSPEGVQSALHYVSSNFENLKGTNCL